MPVIQPHHRTRFLCAIGATSCAAAMAFALFLEHFVDLEPCKLCYLQRAIVILLGCVFFIAFLHNPAKLGLRLYAGLCTILCFAGLATAGRHIWLQNLPEERVPACGPSIDYMLEVFTFLETLKSIWEGAGDCAEVSWRFLGLTIPEQLMLYFIAMTLYSLYILCRPSSTSGIASTGLQT